MNNTSVQLAKRELHSFFNTRAAWIGTLAAGVLLGLAAPFDTDAVMRLIPRVVYWVGVAMLTFLTGSIINAVLRPPLLAHFSIWIALPVVSLVTALLITVEIFGLNALIFGFVPTALGLMTLFANVFAVSLVIALSIMLILESGPNTPQAAPQPSDSPATDQPRILARLPFAKRGTLVALSSVDHYVDVITTQGTETLLMRLSDAIAECDPVPGLQVHRSHWVATDQIADVTRGAGKAVLTLSNAQTIPVSRANLPLLKEAGLLPT